MNPNESQTILLEILRVGLISIRNLSEYPAKNRRDVEKLKQWANLCHNIPIILMGKCEELAVRFFIKWHLEYFCSGYPARNDADFGQIVKLRAELIAMYPPNEVV